MNSNLIIFIRYSLLLLALAMGSSEAMAQLTVERTVLASSGNTAQSGTLQVDWTLGEAFVKQLASGSLLVNEGFQQGRNAPASYVSPALNQAHWTLFPQPANQFLHLQYEASSGQSYQLRLSDLLGRERYQTTLRMGEGIQTEEISLSGWNAGFYLVQVTNESQQVVFQRKWIKE